MGSIDNVLEKLNKYHGQPKEFKIKNDLGEEDTWKIYPLPNKYLPLFLELQKVTDSVPTKNVDGNSVPDEEKMTIEQKTQLMEMNREIVSTTISFSECVNEGILDYKNFDKGTPDRVVETVKAAVDSMSAEYMQKFMLEIAKVNEVSTETKKEVVSQ